MVEVASYEVGVDVNLKQLNKETAQLKQGTQQAAAQLQNLSNATNGVQKAATQTAGSLKELNKQKQEAINGAANLGRFMRVLTTDLLGVNVASIALGTALGNVLTQAVSRVIVAVIQGTTQFNRLRNELALVSGGMADVSRDFNLIEQASQGSSRNLDELTQDWIRLREQVTQSGGDVELARKRFLEFNQTLSEVQQKSISIAGADVATAFGRVLTGFDSLLRISNLIVFALEQISKVLNYIASWLPKQTNPLQEQLSIYRQIVLKLQEAQELQRTGTGTIKERKDLEVEINQLILKRSESLAKLKQLQKLDPATKERRDEVLRGINDDAQHIIDNFRKAPIEQEIQAQMKRALDALRQFGPVAAEEFIALQNQITRGVFASNFQSLRDSLLTAEALERESYDRRLALIQGFGDALGMEQAETNQFLAFEQNRHFAQMEMIQQQNAEHLIRAQIRTGQQLANVLQLLGQKSKAAAVAAIAVNTALAVSAAIQNTAAAATRAMFELGPVAGPPVAAGIKAWGAAEVALIIAAGALQIGGAMKGSSGGPSLSTGGGGGGGGSGSTTISEEEVAPDRGRAITIYMSRGALYTREEVQELMDRMGDEVKNGATLISTKILPT